MGHTVFYRTDKANGHTEPITRQFAMDLLIRSHKQPRSIIARMEAQAIEAENGASEPVVCAHSILEARRELYRLEDGRLPRRFRDFDQAELFALRLSLIKAHDQSNGDERTLTGKCLIALYHEVETEITARQTLNRERAYLLEQKKINQPVDTNNRRA